MATYSEVVSVIEGYYNGADAWAALTASGLMNDPNAIQILESLENVNVVRNGVGEVIGIDLLESFSGFDPVTEAEYIIDSNAAVAEYGANAFNTRIPSSMVAAGGGSALVSGAKFLGGTTVASSVAGFATLASLCVPLATKLGKVVSQSLYNSAPSFWSDHVPGWDPTTWDELTTIATSETEANIMRVLFSVDDQNEASTMYINEKALAYIYGALVSAGVYSEGAVLPEPSEQETTISVTSLLSLEHMYHLFIDELSSHITLNEGSALSDLEAWFANRAEGDYAIIATCYVPFLKGEEFTGTGATTFLRFYFIPVVDNEITVNYYGSGISVKAQGIAMIRLEDWSSTREGRITFSAGDSSWYTNYPRAYVDTGAGVTISLGEYYYNNSTSPYSYSASEPSVLNGWRIVVSNVNGTWGSGVTGIDTDTTPGTVVPSPDTITGTDVDTILEQLKQQYPSLFANSVYEDVPQEDGTTKRITYVPVPMAEESAETQPATIPSTINQTQPVTGTAVQTEVEVEPQTATETLLQTIINTLTTTAEAPRTGKGNSPIIIPPIGGASSLWRVYNPTQAQVDSFGSWLWSSDLVEQIKKLFNDPMQAIIGIHKVFASPSVGGTTTIKCGYIDSGVTSNYINNQYSYINCGTVDLREYFGNVFDYSPYTEVNLYLPFIGIVRLDTADVMRGTIGVKYSVDVITGACLAEVTVTRDNAGGIIYTFSGSAIVTYPLSSGSYVGAIGGVLSIAAGVAGTIATGGAIAPMALGALAGASRLHTDVQKSGSFTGCAGAMGVKKPYLIISRPQTAMADRFQHFTGIPSNSLVTLSACSGYTRVNSVHVENIQKATDEEKTRIEQLLKSGVTI